MRVDQLSRPCESPLDVQRTEGPWLSLSTRNSSATILWETEWDYSLHTAQRQRDVLGTYKLLFLLRNTALLIPNFCMQIQSSRSGVHCAHVPCTPPSRSAASARSSPAEVRPPQLIKYIYYFSSIATIQSSLRGLTPRLNTCGHLGVDIDGAACLPACLPAAASLAPPLRCFHHLRLDR